MFILGMMVGGTVTLLAMCMFFVTKDKNSGE